jgi:hypothetical protein
LFEYFKKEKNKIKGIWCLVTHPLSLLEIKIWYIFALVYDFMYWPILFQVFLKQISSWSSSHMWCFFDQSWSLWKISSFKDKKPIKAFMPRLAIFFINVSLKYYRLWQGKMNELMCPFHHFIPRLLSWICSFRTSQHSFSPPAFLIYPSHYLATPRFASYVANFIKINFFNIIIWRKSRNMLIITSWDHIYKVIILCNSNLFNW